MTSIYLHGNADRVQLVEDPRSRQMLRRLARWTNCSMSKLMRSLLFEAYLRLFRTAPEGEAFVPVPRVSPARRARQNAYSTAHRAARREGKTLEQARVEGRRAGERAARAKAAEERTE